MAKNIAGARVLYQVQRKMLDDYAEIATSIVNEATPILVRAQRGDSVPNAALDNVLGQIGVIVERKFSQGRRAYDGVRPLSPFAAALNNRLTEVMLKAVKAHADYMFKHLPRDLRLYLLSATRQAEQIRLTNPMANYEPAHTWVDPNGYTLSNRVWMAGQNIRLRIDQMLTDGIRQGRSAVALAKDLEQFLLPGLSLKRTKKPYGRNVSYHAMVLARTEISRAHSAATFAASRANPFVDGMDWALSARHPKVDICDRLATIGMGGQRLKPAYPLDDAPMVVVNSHPQCICTNRPTVSETEGNVVNYLRDRLVSGKPPVVTPLRLDRFMRPLLGDLHSLVAREIATILEGYFI